MVQKMTQKWLIKCKFIHCSGNAEIPDRYATGDAEIQDRYATGDAEIPGSDDETQFWEVGSVTEGAATTASSPEEENLHKLDDNRGTLPPHSWHLTHQWHYIILICFERKLCIKWCFKIIIYF